MAFCLMTIAAIPAEKDLTDISPQSGMAQNA
jgi:hypothetical protein